MRTNKWLMVVTTVTLIGLALCVTRSGRGQTTVNLVPLEQTTAWLKRLDQWKTRYDRDTALGLSFAKDGLTTEGQTNCTTYLFGYSTNSPRPLPPPGFGSAGIRARTILPANASWWDLWEVEVCATNGVWTERMLWWTNGWLFPNQLKGITVLPGPWRPIVVQPPTIPTENAGQTAAQ